MVFVVQVHIWYNVDWATSSAVTQNYSSFGTKWMFSSEQWNSFYHNCLTFFILAAFCHQPPSTDLRVQPSDASCSDRGCHYWSLWVWKQELFPFFPAWPSILGGEFGNLFYLHSLQYFCVYSWRLGDKFFVMALLYCWSMFCYLIRLVNQVAWMIIKYNCLFI